MAKTSGGHAHRHHHGSHKPPLCADNDSPNKVHFKQLKPRVGSQFQTRVPKLGSARSSRPAPEHMSTDDLHAIELEKDEVMDTDSSSSSTTVGYGPMHYKVPLTVRGGLCVHRPSDDCDDLVVVKRHTVTAATSSNRKRARPEEEEHVLKYLELRHRGNVETAQLSLLVASFSGRAYQARRSLHKREHRERFRRPSITSSQSWIQRLDRICPIDHYVSECGQSSRDMKRVWKQVLHRGQEMRKTLDRNESKPLLSEVLAYLSRARNLPTPEESYGTRHIVVEGISENIHAILNHVSKAHDARAKLFDILYDEENEGVDMTGVKCYLEEQDETLSIRLDEMNVLEKQLDLAADWQARVDGLEGDSSTEDCRDELKASEQLLEEASCLGIRWRGQVQLENRVQEAYQLRDRLVEWQKSCAERKKMSLKFVSALVRDANRLNLNFPQVSELLKFHQTAEAWVDRANVAVRSRISLWEIQSLIDLGENMPLDLSDFSEKLQTRVRLSQCWLSGFQDLVPAPFSNGKVNNLEWMSRMREALCSEEKRFVSQLYDMATEGTRIPVEIDCVKLLLVEIDAKNWSSKAEKWIPVQNGTDDENMSGQRRAKLVDIRDHLTKAVSLREKLSLSPAECEAWVLEGEAELKAIIDAADDWFEQYEEYLEYDNRRNTERSCLSLATLQQIVDEGNLIYANIGSASGKMSRILGQAVSWHEEFGDLLVRSGVSSAPLKTDCANRLVTLEEINAAVESAASNVSLDLDEALALRDLGDRLQKWQDRVLVAAPTRSKRVGKGKHQCNRYSVDDLIALINEAATLPIQTEEDVERLREQLSKVHQWRLSAQHELTGIATGFRTLRQAVNSACGLPHVFNDVGNREANSTETAQDGQQQQPVTDEAAQEDQQQQPVTDECMNTSMSVDTENVTEDAPETAEDSSQTDTASIPGSELDTATTSQMGGGGSALYKTISALLKSSKLTCIRTSEEEVIEVLEKVAKWILRSLKCIDSPKEVYEKKTFRPFDEFIETGDELLAFRESSMEHDDAELTESLSSSWGGLLTDQLVRLKALQSHRDKFKSWSINAQQVLSSKENRVTLEALNELAEQSYDYPDSSDIVQKIRNVARRATKWRQMAAALIVADERQTMQKVKDLFEEGENLNLACDELKVLRTAIRSARGWAGRVKRCKIDQGGANSNFVSKLIAEYDTLLISMPEEFSKLNQEMKGYCLCRQPYDGFMIGCDGCSEWYHGPCIGVSESQADRTNKFLCVRCCVKKVFKTSAAEIASTIRKWSDPKELKNARQLEAQKHQRKIRKENRDIEKLAVATETLANELNELRLKATSGTGELQAEAGVPVSPFSRQSVINDDEGLRPTLSAEDHFECANNFSEDSKEPEAGNIEVAVEMNHTDAPKPVGPSSLEGFNNVSGGWKAREPENVETAVEMDCTDDLKPAGPLSSKDSNIDMADEMYHADEPRPAKVSSVEAHHFERVNFVSEQAPDAESIVQAVELDDAACPKLAGASSSEASLPRKREIEIQLNQAAKSVKASGDRLAALTLIASERKQIEDREDEKRAELIKWCIRLRSLVLVPSTIERAVSSQPPLDGSLSAPMLQVLRDALILGIGQLSVVAEVENAFKCIAWSCLAMSTLAKRPSFREVCLLVSECAGLKLPEEKSLRMMKSMLQRARFWHSKVEKVLAPMPGETQPVSVDVMKGLMEGASDIPLSLPGETCLQNVIDDKGTRYCLCGGPHYGSFMLECDKCERWYHGHCVNVNKEEGEAVDTWLCPPCQGVPGCGRLSFRVESLEIIDDDDNDDLSESDGEKDVATNAPVPEKLWPPFGLLHAQTAIDVLGEECCAIEDDVDALENLSQKQNGNGFMLPALPIIKSQVIPLAEMTCCMMADSGGMQASISYVPLTDPPVVKVASTSAIVTTNPLASYDQQGLTDVSDATLTTSSCAPVVVTSDEHHPCSNRESVHHETHVSVALNVRETEIATKQYRIGMVDCSLSNSDKIMNGASPLNGHAQPEVCDGHALASPVNASIVHDALPTYEYATGVQMAAAIASVATTPGAYSMVSSLVNARSSDLIRQKQVDAGQDPRPTNRFDRIMAETMVTVPDNGS